MGNFPRLAWTNLIGRQSYDRDGFSIQRSELDLIAFPFLMNEHDSANIISCKPVLGQITGQDHIFKFPNHGRLSQRVSSNEPEIKARPAAFLPKKSNVRMTNAHHTPFVRATSDVSARAK